MGTISDGKTGRKLCAAKQRIRKKSLDIGRCYVVVLLVEKGCRFMAKKRANGEGNIRKRKDGRWEGRYTAGYDPATGKRIIKNVLGKTQAEIKEKLAQAIDSTKNLDVARPDDYTVATWLAEWYEICAQPNIRLATAERYKMMMDIYTVPRIGGIKLAKLTAHDLQKLYKDLQENGRVNPGKMAIRA